MEADFDFKDIVESANDLIIVTKPDPEDATKQIIVYVNPAFTRLTEFSYTDAVGKNTKLLGLSYLPMQDSSRPIFQIACFYTTWNPSGHYQR